MIESRDEVASDSFVRVSDSAGAGSTPVHCFAVLCRSGESSLVSPSTSLPSGGENSDRVSSSSVVEEEQVGPMSVSGHARTEIARQLKVEASRKPRELPW